MTTLRDLALKYGTDKAGGRDNPDRHEYCEAYEFFLSRLSEEAFFTMLEIGIGGYHFPDRGGESLRMWREYFPVARIFALDLYEKRLNIPYVSIYQGGQDDPEIMKKIYSDMHGHPALIIDDASHIPALTLKTFEICWPLLAPGGIYVIEDVHASYWTEGGFNGGYDNPATPMNYFKDQADWLNLYHWNGRGLRMQEMAAADDVESVHFFKEIIFIRKKV